MSQPHVVDRALKVLVLFCIVLMIAVCFDSKSWPTEAEQAQESVATIETPTGWGSAVAFKVKGTDRIFFLTAKHVVDKRGPFLIRVDSHSRGFKAGKFTVPAQVVFSSPGCDAAILTIPPVEWKFRGAKIEKNLPHVGDDVYAVGNMHGANFDRTVSQGIVAQQGVVPQDAPGFPWALVDQTTAINLPGSSGGAVFSRDGGKLIGIQVGNMESAVFLYLPSRVLLAHARAEGWAWLFGEGRITEEAVGELLAKSAAKSADESIASLLRSPERSPETSPEAPPASAKGRPGPKPRPEGKGASRL
jgi:hypothetical protein